MNGTDNDVFIVNIKNDTGTRSSYSKDISSTDSCREIRIRHSVSFDVVDNATPFYATVYGLTEEELPTTTCPSGVFTLPVPGLCYGGSQDCSNQTVGYLVFLRNASTNDDISTDQGNHIQYRNDVFLPWVESTRQYYLQREVWEGGDDVDDNKLWV